MTTLTEFNDSLKLEKPNDALSSQLKSLWYDGKGDWRQAHSCVDQSSDKESALIHAYLHRKEGDIWNADYWYRKTGKIRPDISLGEEWEQLVLKLLKQDSGL